MLQGSFVRWYDDQRSKGPMNVVQCDQWHFPTPHPTSWSSPPCSRAERSAAAADRPCAGLGPRRRGACGGFDLEITKSTGTHHFRVLREAGVIEQRRGGHLAAELAPPGGPRRPLPRVARRRARPGARRRLASARAAALLLLRARPAARLGLLALDARARARALGLSLRLLGLRRLRSGHLGRRVALWPSTAGAAGCPASPPLPPPLSPLADGATGGAGAATGPAAGASCTGSRRSRLDTSIENGPFDITAVGRVVAQQLELGHVAGGEVPAVGVQLEDLAPVAASAGTRRAPRASALPSGATSHSRAATWCGPRRAPVTSRSAITVGAPISV